jgi:hypothetical protein
MGGGFRSSGTNPTERVRPSVRAVVPIPVTWNGRDARTGMIRRSQLAFFVF